MTEFSPGDIVEIATGRGLAYAHVTHMHPSYPPVVRLLGGLHAERPADPGAGEAALTALVPLGEVLRKLGLAHEVVARVAPEAGAFPTFRMPIRDKQGEIVYWWYWDGRGLSFDAGREGAGDLPLREVMGAARFQEALDALG